MATDSIGDVSVDVTADTTRFEERLRAKLKELNKTLRARITALVNTKVATTVLTAWVKRQSLKRVKIGVEISKKGLAMARAQILALTGVTALRGEFTKFTEGIQSFFENLPALAKKLVKFGSITSVVGTLIGALAISLASLGPAVQGLGAAVLALPGILAGVGASLAVLVVALKNAPQAVKDAASSFSGLKDIVVDNFWAGAAANVSSFLRQLGPQVKAGMGPVAAEMGNQVSALAGALRSVFTNDVTAEIFRNITAGISALIPAMAPFANILKNLLLFGTSLLPGISTWLTKIANQFDAWLQDALETGKLNEMLANLGTWLKAAGNALASFGSIISGIATAALDAGIGGLFAGLEKIAAIVNSPPFQQTLTQFFVYAAAGAEGLFKALGPIGNMFTALMPILGSFIQTAGETLGQVFTTLADSMSDPAFKEGLSAFFGGILGFIRPLIPVIPIIVEKFAELGTLAGNILSTLGPVLASAIESLLPIFNQLLVALGPVIDALGPVLISIMEALAPVIGELLTAFMPILDLVVALLPALTPIITALGTGLATAIQTLAPFFMQLAAALLPVIMQLAQILMPLIGPLIGLLAILLRAGLQPLIIVFNILAGVLEMVGPLFEIVALIIGAVIETIVALFNGDFQKIGEIWTTLWESLVTLITSLGDKIGKIIWDFVQGWVAFFVQFWTDVLSNISAFGAKVKGVWDGFWSGLGGIVKGAWNGILGWIEGGVNGALKLINGMIKGINGISGAVGIPAIPLLPTSISLPRLAEGATVLPRRGGTAAILGEGGRAESVVDTGKLNAMLDLVLRKFPKSPNGIRESARGFGAEAQLASSTTHMSNTFPITTGGDPAQVAQEVVNRLAEKVGL